MSPLAIGALGIAALFGLMLAQVPIGFAMIIVGIVGFALQTGWAPALTLLASEPSGVLSSVDLAAVPLFLLMGTFATAAPLWGLFGSVLGMVELFGSLRPTGANPADLAHGISVVLYNTALGLIVAIVALIFYRYFRARVDSIVLDMEQQAIKLVEVLHGERK